MLLTWSGFSTSLCETSSAPRCSRAARDALAIASRRQHAVSAGSGSIAFMHWVIPLAALVGTLLQTYTSMKDAGRAHRAVVADWVAEDELVDSTSRWRPILRWRTRRELVAMRPTDVHKTIRHLNIVIIGWMLLDFAAAAALYSAVT